MIIDIHDVWHGGLVEHEKYVRARMALAWGKLYRPGPPALALTQVHEFVDKHEAEIVGAGTLNYLASITDYDLRFPPNTAERSAANAILETVFDYDKFRDAATGWNAYSLCQSSPYTVCPYCHLVPTNTEEKDNRHKGYRPQLDHFIAKADYPFLALSLGNLVPSCPTCNGPTMKHTTNVLTDPHLFPLADTAVLTFRLRPKRGQPWSPLLQALRVPLNAYEIVIDAPSGNVAAENSLRTFQLHSRYQSFLHDAYRLARVGKNPAWLQTITSVLGINLSVEDHLGFSIKNNSVAFKNVPQGKMRMDVYLDSRTW